MIIINDMINVQVWPHTPSAATPAQCAGVAAQMSHLAVETMITCDCFLMCLHIEGELICSHAYSAVLYMVASLLEALEAYSTVRVSNAYSMSTILYYCSPPQVPLRCAVCRSVCEPLRGFQQQF